ncbi:hypothetical protein L1887_59837 [Cichorium endivia]|nr:hypothetical protein L1887_59837 [Cichorium endivia]
MVLYGCTRFGFVLLATLIALSCLPASLAAPVRPILPAYTETGHHVAFWQGNDGGAESREPGRRYPLVHVPSDLTSAGLTSRPFRLLRLENDHTLAALRAERSRFDPTLATLRAHPIFVGRGTQLEARALDLAFRAGALRKIHVMVPVPVNQEWYSMLRIPYTPESQQHPPLLIYELFVDRMLPPRLYQAHWRCDRAGAAESFQFLDQRLDDRTRGACARRDPPATWAVVAVMKWTRLHEPTTGPLRLHIDAIRTALGPSSEGDAGDRPGLVGFLTLNLNPFESLPLFSSSLPYNSILAMVAAKRTIKLTCALVLLLSVVATVSAQGDNKAASPAASQAPSAGKPAQGGQLASSPNGDDDDDDDDGGNISSPAGGADAKTILAHSSHMMGSNDDATDGDEDAKDPHATAKKHNGGHNGQCVTECASKSTQDAGCGTDLSKPDCFCKAPSFVDGTFACINATCPQQFHGAAGVIKSICSVAGAPDLKIPGYTTPDNLEHMPTINDGNSTNTTTPATGTAGGSAAGAGAGAGSTSTFTMPKSMQTHPTTPSTSGSGSGSGTATTSGAGRMDMVGVVSMAAAAVTIASAAGLLVLI